MSEATDASQLPAGPRPSGWRRLARWLGRAVAVLAVLLIVLALVHRPLLVGFAHAFRVDNPAPSGAIVVLLGGSPHRPQKAAELYRGGLAPVVLYCRERPDPIFPFDTNRLLHDYLVKLGVPDGAIVELPGEVGSTFDEANRVRAYLAAHPTRRITVVTTAFHTRRARRVFQRVLRGLDVDVRAAAATDPSFDESNWYRNENGLVFYFSETIKTILYWVKY